MTPVPATDVRRRPAADGAVLEARTRSANDRPHVVSGRHVGAGVGPRRSAASTWAVRRAIRRLARDASTARSARRRIRARAGLDLGVARASRMTWALVPLMPKDETPARRGRSAGRPVAARSVSSSTAPADQSTCGVGSSTCRVCGSTPCRIAMHHLDHAGDAGGGLGVADVGLDRAQPAAAGRRPVLAVGGEQRLGLDRVAERGAGAVCLDGVDCRRRRPALARACRITRCCDGPLGRSGRCSRRPG